MKAIILFIILIFIEHKLFSQKSFYDRAGKTNWAYDKIMILNLDKQLVSNVSIDSVLINNKYYRRFGEILIRDSFPYLYVKRFYTDKEILIIDYSKSIGDSFLVQVDNRNLAVHVDNKDTIVVQGDKLLRLNLRYQEFPNRIQKLIWIQSIGCITYPFHPIFYPYYYDSYELYYHLSCVHNGDTSLLDSFDIKCFYNDNLIQTNRKWHTWISGDNGDHKTPKPYQYIGKDTVILGNKYGIFEPYIFLRYDNASKKYYFYRHNQSEFLAMNEGAQLGDTVSQFYNSNVAEKIEFSYFGGKYRKLIITAWDTFVSGIGSIKRVFWTNHLAHTPETKEGNICYEENNSTTYHFSDFYNFNQQCSPLSRLFSSSKERIDYYPNPSYDFLYTDHSSPKSFQIYNLIGQRILSGNFTNKIDIRALEKGIYFLYIDHREGLLKLKIKKE